MWLMVMIMRRCCYQKSYNALDLLLGLDEYTGGPCIGTYSCKNIDTRQANDASCEIGTLQQGLNLNH